jgi:outer membrane biosynthesis protein TonB
VSHPRVPAFDAVLRTAVAFLFALGCEHRDAPAEPAPPRLVQPAPPPRSDLAEPPPPPPPPEPETTNSAPAAAARPRKGPGTSAPVAARAASPCDGECRGGATAELQSALRLEAVRARSCYERALSQNAGLSGNVVVSLRLGPSGEVCSAALGKDTLGDSEVTACVMQRFRGANFPKPGGGCVDVAVPINFVPHKSGG